VFSNDRFAKCQGCVLCPPGAIKDNASFTASAIDTLGFDYALIAIQVGATDIAMAALKLQESDASGSGYADVTSGTFDGSTDLFGSTAALPSATDDNAFFLIAVDLRKRKRYLKIVATAGDGTSGSYLAAMCILSRAKITPNTAAEMGASSVLAP
jgi:hypothetical protein